MLATPRPDLGEHVAPVGLGGLLRTIAEKDFLQFDEVFRLRRRVGAKSRHEPCCRQQFILPLALVRDGPADDKVDLAKRQVPEVGGVLPHFHPRREQRGPVYRLLAALLGFPAGPFASAFGIPASTIRTTSKPAFSIP